jgi:hypothetical protein
MRMQIKMGKKIYTSNRLIKKVVEKWKLLKEARKKKIKNTCKLYYIKSLLYMKCRLSFMKKILPKYFDGEWSYA